MKLILAALLIFSCNAWADRVGVNGFGRPVILTEKPCDLHIEYKEPLKLAETSIIVDGEVREVKGCYLESLPDINTEQTASDASVDGNKLDIEMFGVVNIFTEDGLVLMSPSSDYKPTSAESLNKQ